MKTFKQRDHAHYPISWFEILIATLSWLDALQRKRICCDGIKWLPRLMYESANYDMQNYNPEDDDDLPLST